MAALAPVDRLMVGEELTFVLKDGSEWTVERQMRRVEWGASAPRLFCYLGQYRMIRRHIRRRIFRQSSDADFLIYLQ